VIHRDLKPANVMITPKGQAKGAGLWAGELWGRRNATQTALETGGVMGTPLYMSPEQAIGQKADARSDCGAWGDVLRVADRVTPFRRASNLAILRRSLTSRFRARAKCGRIWPVLAEQIVERAAR